MRSCRGFFWIAVLILSLHLYARPRLPSTGPLSLTEVAND
ncbi:hypothetical protein KNP414_03251 [Paenibacillus mucilaginosus KNP414]|uniref:Uncharacterized protein n=1 Tax=Paenibacillus mucilaginosus (strain KNP414) TaxID=1036673 RepID=F8FF91_PAEMK|nr:hypothetical protein KNP414_03251 [Paenibacillus mucilaginosus KNP414]